MAARFWRWVLAALLALASGAAVTSVIVRPLSFWVALGIALAGVAAAPLMLVAASLAAAWCHDPARRNWRHGIHGLRTLLSETVRFSAAVLRMCAPAGRRAEEQERSPDAPTARPVLLLHGLLCNRGVWRPLEARLRAAGIAPVRALNMEPLLADVELQAGRVAPQLLALQRACGGARVAIVAHSMGGLVARTLLGSLGPGAIGRIVTLGTPHHGTGLARGLRWPATQQLAPDSAWLGALNAAQEGRLAVPLTCVYSREDNLIAPAASARLRGAQCLELHGLGHFGLLSRRRALDAVVAALAPT